MRYDLYLSYSGRKSYLGCPKRYEHGYILKTRVIRDKKNSFFGTAIGKVFEWFYERALWKSPDPVQACIDSIEEAIRYTFESEKWDESEDPEVRRVMERSMQLCIPGGVEAIRANGLLTPLSRAETDLTVTYTSTKHNLTMKLGGRADFIHGTSAKDLWLLDGKASKYREQYVDPEQLIWYAVQHYIKYHVAPVRLGFLFWSFPEKPLSWIEFGPDDLRNSVNKTFEVAEKIRLKQFEPTPSTECYGCDYLKLCPDGNKFIANRKVETGGRIESTVFDLEIVT